MATITEPELARHVTICRNAVVLLVTRDEARMLARGLRMNVNRTEHYGELFPWYLCRSGFSVSLHRPSGPHGPATYTVCMSVG